MIYGADVDLDDEGCSAPAGEKVAAGLALGVAPLLDDARARGGVEAGTVGSVARHAGFQGGRGHIQRGACATDIVEERIVAQAGEDAKMPLRALHSALDTGIATRGIELIQAAFGRYRRVEIALDRGRGGCPAQRLPAIDLERVAHVVGEFLSDNRHDQIELPPIGRHPGIKVADIGRRIGDHGRRVEMIRGRGRCDEQRDERQRLQSVACVHATHFNRPARASLSNSLASEPYRT